MIPDKTITRFWRKVRKTDSCWLWIGSDAERYGKFRLLGHDLPAHRASWVIHFGVIPDGLFVCHTCDTPNCVRPDHLFLGTPQMNTADMMRKGRNRVPSREVAQESGRKGGYIRAARLSPEQRSAGARTAQQAVRNRSNQNVAKTHCPKGHLYDYEHKGARHCRTCQREASRRWKAKRLAALRAAGVEVP